MRSIPPVAKPAGVLARLLALGLTVSVLLAAACANSSGSEGAATLSDPAATGTELVTEFLQLVQNKDAAGLSDLLSDAFIIQRADGTTSEKAEYLQNIPELRAYEVSDVRALQAGDVLVVRWSLVADVTINGQTFSGDPAPRLSTFVYEDGSWRLASYANFNVPAEN